MVLAEPLGYVSRVDEQNARFSHGPQRSAQGGGWGRAIGRIPPPYGGGPPAHRVDPLRGATFTEGASPATSAFSSPDRANTAKGTSASS